MMCNLMGFSRDSYYKRLKRDVKSTCCKEKVLELIKDKRKELPRTGGKKLHISIAPDLKRLGLKYGRDRIFDLLREEDMLIERKKKYQKTTYSNHNYVVAPNMLKNAVITGSNQAFVSDITYVALRKGFAYLFLVTDLYSRKIVGFHLSKDLSNYSAILALGKAITGLSNTQGIIHHSDRGTQYCCHDFLEYLSTLEMIPSMTDESHCYQNAVAERVNGILKDEFNIDAVFNTFGDALSAVTKSIKLYNTKRLHWSLNRQTPEEVYANAA
jgi:putative transposase